MNANSRNVRAIARMKLDMQSQSGDPLPYGIIREAVANATRFLGCTDIDQGAIVSWIYNARAIARNQARGKS